DLETNNAPGFIITNGLTLNGTLNINGQNQVYFNGTQTLGGSGAIVFTYNGSGGGTPGGLRLNATNMTLTIGPNMTVRGGYGALAQFTSNTTVINQGTIAASSQGAINISVSNFTNAAADVNGPGGRLQVSASNATLTVSSGTGWTNQGAITLS